MLKNHKSYVRRLQSRFQNSLNTPKNKGENLLSEEETIQTLKSIDQEDFQQISSTLLEKMGFEVSSIEARDSSILVEGDIERGGKVRNYLIKCTRSEENLKNEIRELHELLGGKKYGLFLTTSLRDRGVEKTERIEFVGGTPFYKLLKKFDMLSQVESYREKLSEEQKIEKGQDEEPDKSNIEELGQKGKKMYQKSNYKEAIGYFEKVLDINPEDHVALNNKALCHLKEGDHKKALESINEAISIKPDFEDAYLNKAFILEKRGELEKAKNTVKKLIDLKPNKAEYHYIHGAYLRKIDAQKDAWVSTQKALELDPQHEKAKELRSILRRELKEKTGKEPEELEYLEIEEIESDLKAEIENLKKENEKLREKLDDKESEISELQNEISELEEEKKKVENKFEMEKNRLRNTIKLKQERIDNLQIERNELREELEDVEEDTGDEEKEESDKDEIETKEKAIKELQTLKYVGPELADRMYKSGYKSIADLKKASQEDLSEIKGMGSAITEKVFEYLQEE